MGGTLKSGGHAMINSLPGRMRRSNKLWSLPEAFSSYRLIYRDSPLSPLRTHHRRIGTNDLRIAAIVLEQQGILMTRNTTDFADIPGL